MGLLDGLMGALGQRGAGDFIQRFERGAPWDGVDDRETMDAYGRVAGVLPPEEYERSAEDAFARFSPEERRQFGRHLREQAHRQDFGFPDLDDDGQDDRLQDPRTLARMTSRLHGAGPGVLRGMLGGGGAGGTFSNPLAKAALAGIAAMAMKRFMGGGRR